METSFSSILNDFPQFPQDMSEQHLALGHDTSSLALSSISVAGNHITERCAISEGGRDISVGIGTRLWTQNVWSSNHGLSRFFFINATTCPLWTSWSPLPVVAEV
jgi:hypothetical protein